jgi:PAS domain S-box-containing protein
MKWRVTMIAVKKREEIQEVTQEATKQDAFADRFKEEKSYMTGREHEEIVLNPKKYILSKTDEKGVIEYGNEYFVEISGYKEEELIGKPHNIIRHPDMPKIVFKFLWQRLQNEENIIAVVKNKAKDGRFYWVMTDFEIKKDSMTNQINGYFAYRKAAPRKAIEAIEPLYKKLVDIEKVSGMDGSYKYLVAHLESSGKTYDQFIDEITGRNGIMKMWFAAMKKFFS